MLVYEILLTRICALKLMFHFAFLVISNCLLGIGASGSLIFLFQERMIRRTRFWVGLLTGLYLLSLIGAYAFLLWARIDLLLDFSRIEDTLAFTFYNLVAAVPFFLGGGVIGWILTVNAERVNTFYFVDLLGAGLGCWFCPLLLWKFGAGGCMVVICLLAVAALVATVPRSRRIVAVVAGIVLGAGGLWLLPQADERFPIRGKWLLDITDTVQARIDGRIQHSEWSATGRIDVIQVDPEQQFMFGRGARVWDLPLPDERYILQDGSAGTYIHDFTGNPGALDILRGTLYSAAVRVKHRPRVFVIGAGGGSDVWAARIHGASFVKAVELHRPILDVHFHVLPEFSRKLTEDPTIEWIHAEGRGALQRETELYDVIQMSGVDTWTSLTSGAYVLAENYLYTTEAIETMYRRLAPGGILQITRWAEDMESLRMISNVHAALGETNEGRLEETIVCLRTHDRLMAFLVRKGPFPPEELEEVVRFAVESGVKIAYFPPRPTESIVDTFIREPNKAAFIDDFPRDISPTTDDRPYFFNFSRWDRPFRTAKHLWEPTITSQGNPLFILSQLAFSIVLAACLILLPLLLSRRRRIDGTHLWRVLLYFSGLGLGFIALELALIQKLNLFLGHPIYSITVTLFVMLVFTGLGSLFSERWFREYQPRAWIVPASITALMGLLLLASSALTSWFIALPIGARIVIASALLAPLGLVLGVPFAYGIRILNRLNPTLIPWAWAVNACLTVVGSILTVVLSMNFGFRSVCVFAVLVYWIAFAALRGLSDRPRLPSPQP
jgi:hypothetical protein